MRTAILQHRGAVSVTSEVGTGTSFQLTFPLATRQGDEPFTEDATPVHGHGLVLVVDDEAVIRATMCSLLASYGYTVIMARDGAEALTVFDEKAEAVDLVILDMVMPEMNGRDCFEALRERRADLPILLTSGLTGREDVLDLIVRGPTTFLAKPYRSAEFSMAVATSLPPA